jgi:hypothetical protein
MRPTAFGVIFGIGSLVGAATKAEAQDAGQMVSVPGLNACYFVGQGMATQQPPSYDAGISGCCSRPSSYFGVTSCVNSQTPSNYVPACNGCGPIDSTIKSGVIDFVATFGNVDFTPACIFHDTCYGTCAAINLLSKYYCDSQFLVAMTDACSAEYSSESLNGQPSNHLVTCNHLANVYYKAVQGKDGDTAYEGGQIASCFCCDGCSDAGDEGEASSGATTLNDPNTGFMWQTPWSTGFYTEPGGVAYCKKLGMSLPSITQLQSLINATSVNILVDQMSGEYWSSTIISGQVEYVFFKGSASITGSDFSTAMYQVRCVR